ncbi:potassium channel family protein [Streptomyces avermitilis]|uniref:potassium channel family protein n=2 Tax=Streptomyces avermitilis TaxID=33903 RepID=UPI003800C898
MAPKQAQRSGQGVGCDRGGTLNRNSGSARRQGLLASVRSLMIAGALVAAYYLLPLGSAFTVGTALGLVGGIAAAALLLAWQIRRITQSPWPGLRAMEAMAATVPLFILLFATAYWLMERSAPNTFSESLSRTDALYFAMTVFSTVGFGDITPRSEPARLLTTGQMTVNLLLIGVAARFLVHAVQEGRRQRDRSTTGGQNGATPSAR